MKRILLLFLAIILAKTICSSQTTLIETRQDSIVSLTSEQLKYTNLIFAEHSKLLVENDLLCSQIKNYQDKINLMESTDSLRVSQISKYEEINKSYSKQIEDLNKSISKKKKTILGLEIGCITVSIGLALFLILK